MMISSFRTLDGSSRSEKVSFIRPVRVYWPLPVMGERRNMIISTIGNKVFQEAEWPESEYLPQKTEETKVLNGMVLTSYAIFRKLEDGIGGAAIRLDVANGLSETLIAEVPVPDGTLILLHGYKRGIGSVSFIENGGDGTFSACDPAKMYQRGEMVILPVFFRPGEKLKEAMDLVKSDPSIQNYKQLCDAVIDLVDNGSIVRYPTNGNIPIPRIMKSTLDGAQSITKGRFRFLKGISPLVIHTPISQIKEYRKNWGYTEEQKKDIPVNPDYLDIPDTVWKLLKAIQRGRRKFLLLGDSGAGKSTIVPILAELLGMVKYTFTCSDGTDETSLISSYGIVSGRKFRSMPSYESLINDPATAYYEMTGEYIDGISGDDVIKALGSNEGSSYKMVDSTIVKACSMPSIIEIAEPFSISRPGVMTALNSLWDDKQTLTKVDGETITCNPDTIFILTSNPNYRASRGLDEATISRMNKVFVLELPSATKMAERAMAYAKLPEAKKDMVVQMATVVKDINEWIRVNSVRGAVCSQRELNDWVDDLNEEDGPMDTVYENILHKVSLDPEIQNEVLDSIIRPILG